MPNVGTQGTVGDEEGHWTGKILCLNFLDSLVVSGEDSMLSLSRAGV